MARRRTDITQLIAQRQQNTFVGRTEQLAAFRRNLSSLLGERTFIFNISGQGGVGKSTLLAHFRDQVMAVKGVVTLVDDDHRDVVTVIEQIAKQLDKQGHDSRKLQERIRSYRQQLQQLDADPEAPADLAQLLGRTAVKIGASAARGIPVAGGALDLLPVDDLATKAGDWTAYLTRKLRNQDEIALVQHPDQVLTPLLFELLDSVPEEHPIVLCFDVYEQTSTLLDPWLRDLLAGSYGPFPDCILVIAGRDPLDRNRWEAYAPVMHSFALEPFTDTEAHEYLASKGISDPRLIELILRLSLRLPLLVAMLANESPSSSADLSDVSGDAVERFLQWVESADQREVALAAALPRRFDRDLLNLMVGPEKALTHFDWLIRQPFVAARRSGWVYHQVVREQMLRYLRRRSRNDWNDRQRVLVLHFEQQTHTQDYHQHQSWQDEAWRSDLAELLYHQTAMGDTEFAFQIITQALELDRLRNLPPLARALADLGQETDHDRLHTWGQQLAQALDAHQAEDWEAAASAWEELHQHLFTHTSLKPLFHCLQIEATARHSQNPTYAVTTLQRIQQQHPTLQLPLRVHYWLCLKLKDYTAALEPLSQLLVLDLDNVDALLLRGVSYYAINRNDEALTDLNHALQIEPEHAFALRARGAVYRMLKRYDEALTDLNHALQLEPEDVFALQIRGEVYRMLKRYNEALTDLTHALQIGPEHAFALANRGGVYRLLKRYDEALTDLNYALQLEPEDAFALASRGAVYALLKRYDEALADLTHALQITPENSFALESRGEVYIQLERYDEALTDLNLALQLEPEDDWAYYLRALIYRCQGNLAAVHADLEQAMTHGAVEFQQHSDDWNRVCNLGLYHLAAGQHTQAWALYQQLLDAHPSAEYFQIALLDLEEYLSVVPDDTTAQEIYARLSAQLPSASP